MDVGARTQSSEESLLADPTIVSRFVELGPGRRLSSALSWTFRTGIPLLAAIPQQMTFLGTLLIFFFVNIDDCSVRKDDDVPPAPL